MKPTDKNLLLLCMMLGLAQPCMASLVDSGFDDAIISKNSWKAGVDEVEQWYGKNYSSNDGYASLLKASNNQSTRVVMQALAMPEAGTYTLSLDVLVSNNQTQLGYWHVLAVKSGANIKLGNKGVKWNADTNKVKSLYRDQISADDLEGDWNTFNGSFTVTQNIASQYDYLVFAFVGSRSAGQVLGFDNVITNAPSAAMAQANTIPEPGMLGLMLVGGGMMSFRRRT
ncbi:MAG: PEP-CTERM sorting domain-containing protein [Phycisphaeraceae bacterium]|nr:PEP-CTERM sorting domain-containing protein [Phycisphaeraceae bacterium]